MNADEARDRGLGAMRGLVFVVLFYASLVLIAVAVWIAAKVLG
jgi:hypothetical protein